MAGYERRYYKPEDLMRHITPEEFACAVRDSIAQQAAPKMLREPARLSDRQFAELRRMLFGLILAIPSVRALCRRSFWNEDTRSSYIEGASIALLIHETPGEGSRGSACIAATEGLGEDFRSLRGISMSLIAADGAIIDGISTDGVMFFNGLRNGTCYRLLIGEGAGNK